jgi:hypothetical protein
MKAKKKVVVPEEMEQQVLKFKEESLSNGIMSLIDNSDLTPIVKTKILRVIINKLNADEFGLDELLNGCWNYIDPSTSFIGIDLNMDLEMGMDDEIKIIE